MIAVVMKKKKNTMQIPGTLPLRTRNDFRILLSGVGGIILSFVVKKVIARNTKHKIERITAVS